MKKSRIIGSALLFLGMLITTVSSAQCFIKSTDQSGGYVTYYIDPELVAQTADFGIALSVQMVGDKYYLAVTYQFAGRAEPVEEKIAISLKNGYTLELDMYTMEVGNAGGIELCMAVFNLEDINMKYFIQSPITGIKFRTKDDVSHSLPVTSAPDVLIRQLKCFKK